MTDAQSQIDVGVERRLSQTLRDALGHDGTNRPPADDAARLSEQARLVEVMVTPNTPAQIKAEDCATLAEVADLLEVDETKAAEQIITAKVPGVSLDVIALALGHLEEKRIGKFTRGIFKESQHPRDSRGRFAKVGSTVSVPGGGKGKIVGEVGGDKVKVRRADGSEREYRSKDVTVTQGAEAGRIAGTFAAGRGAANAPGFGQPRPRREKPLTPEEEARASDDAIREEARNKERAKRGLPPLKPGELTARRRDVEEQEARRAAMSPKEAAALAAESDAEARAAVRAAGLHEGPRERNARARAQAPAKKPTPSGETRSHDRERFTPEETEQIRKTARGKIDEANAAVAAAKTPEERARAEKRKREVDAEAATAEDILRGRVDEPPGALDERLVNYKPERDLSDPSKTTDLADMLPNARMQPYSKSPFLDEMHRLMGVADPMTHDVGDYLKKRDELFTSQPLQDVPFDQVVVTQPRVRGERVQQIRDHPETGGSKPQHFVRFNGETYVMNGHHRVAAQILNGDRAAKGHLLDLDQRPPDDRVDRSNWTGGHAPNGHEGVGARKKDGKPYGTGYPDADPRSDPAYDEYVEAVNAKLDAKMAELGDTESRFDKVDGKPGAYNAERQAVHERILDQLMKKYENVPKEYKAVVMAGPPGAGKSTVIKTSGREFGVEANEKGDPTNYAVVNPDDMKEELIHAGAMPHDYYDTGIAPAEGATFSHEESSYLAEQFRERLIAGGYNLILDGTFAGKPDKQVSKVHQLRASGYVTTGVLVDGTVDKSLQNAGFRHKQAPANPGGPYRGRYVPVDLIQSNAPKGDEGDSKVFGRPHRNRSSENIERVQDAFDGGVMWYDNSTGESKRVKSTKPDAETAAIRKMDAVSRRIEAVSDEKVKDELRAILRSLEEQFDFEFDSLESAWARAGGPALEEKVDAALGDAEGKAEGGFDKNRGNAERLRRYWTRGEGSAKIRWGEEGDHMRCVKQMVEHGKFTTAQAHGYCNLREKEATGKYPAQHAKEKAITWMEGVIELKATVEKPVETPPPGDAEIPNVNDQPTGVMVALYPPDDVAQQLALDSGVPVEELHVTLAYLGNVAELGDQVAELVDVVSAFSDDSYDLNGEVSGLGRFSNADEQGGGTTDAFVALVDAPDLTDFRTDVVDALEEAGFTVRKDHGFTPHITLAYLEASADLPSARLAPLPCVFGTLSLAYGGDVYDFPLHPSDSSSDPVAKPEPKGEGNAPYDGKQPSVRE